MNQANALFACPECYLATHYGADEVISEHWNRTNFVEATTDATYVGNSCPDHEYQEHEAGKCKVCGEESDGIVDFSYSACDICGTTLGGQRYRVMKLRPFANQDGSGWMAVD